MKCCATPDIHTDTVAQNCCYSCGCNEADVRLAEVRVLTAALFDIQRVVAAHGSEAPEPMARIGVLVQTALTTTRDGAL